MAKLIITHMGTVIKELQLTNERTTVGRRPDNDIVLDDQTVSGQHAAFLNLQNFYIEDLNSTNGVLLNGKKVSKRQLAHGDVIRIGKHELKFIDAKVQDFESTVILNAGSEQEAKPEAPTSQAFVMYDSGPHKGERISLNKPYTKLGSGASVAVIARRGANYYLMPMSGTGGVSSNPAKLNGNPVGAESMMLSSSDIIEVAGSRLKFILV